jgi:hypothetical protein
MNFKLILKILYLICLGALSCEILVRRWALGQIPPQVGPWVIYSTLLVNGAVLFYFLKRPVKTVAKTKTDKN